MLSGLLLVKNLYKERVIFYWVDTKGKRVSSVLHTQMAAEDWWKQYMFSQYEGEERRRSVLDRRECSTTRKLVKERKQLDTTEVGRRDTDVDLDVHIDLYQKKIREVISEIN
ncbi:MAG: hypothetical protein ACRBB6_08475 [Neptuniibacter sp.]